MYYLCGITDKGIPQHNEDALLLHRTVRTEGQLRMAVDAPFMAAVCDGVSGEAAGELASRTCLTRLAEVKYNKKINLKRRILEIHESITRQSRSSAEIANMQTTLCGIAVDETHALHCFNVGDSRLYRYRGGVLEQISRDQTLVQMLYEEGAITSEQKKVHTHRNVVLPVMGNLEEAPKPDVITFLEGIEYGDVLLISTDGLTDYLTSGELEELLALPKPLPERLAAMVSQALAKGGRDNITIAAVVRYPNEIPIPHSLL